MLTSLMCEYTDISGEREPEAVQILQREELAILQTKIQIMEERLARVEDCLKEKQTTTGRGGGETPQCQYCRIG